MVVETSLLLLFVFDLALIAVVYLYNSRGTINRLLSLLFIPITLSNLEMLLFYAARGRLPQVIGNYMAYFGAIFFYPLIYTFTFYFPRKTIKKRNLPKLVVVFLAPVILGLLAAGFFTIQRDKDPMGVLRSLGIWFSLQNLRKGGFLYSLTSLGYTFYILVLLSATVHRLIRSLKGKLLPRERNNILFTLGGFIPLSFILLFNYLIFPYIKGGIYLYLLFSGLHTLYFTFLTLRFGFLDRKALVRVFIVNPIIILLLVLFYNTFLNRLNNLATEILDLDITLIISLEIIFFIALFSPLITVLMKKLVSPSGEAAPALHEQLRLLSARLVNIIDIHELDRILHTVFRGNLKIVSFAFLLMDDTQDRYSPLHENSENFILPAKGELCAKLFSERRILGLQDIALSWEKGEELEILDRGKIQLVAPLIEKNLLVGMCLLGDPGVVRSWSRVEIEELEIFFSGIPVVVDRCRIHSRAIEMEKKLARIEKSAVLSEITSSLAHELRNPLSIIQTSAETLSSKALPKEDIAKLGGYIQEETERVCKMLNKLLSFAGTSDLKPERVELYATLQRVFDLLTIKAKKKGISLDLPRFQEEVYVFMDKEGLIQVCMNLSLNALEATNPGGYLKCEIEIRRKNYVTLYFLNNGEPITEEIQKRLFEPFFTTKKDGTGLGLAVSQRIIRQSGGEISFAGTGDITIFKMELPLSPASRGDLLGKAYDRE